MTRKQAAFLCLLFTAALLGCQGNSAEPTASALPAVAETPTPTESIQSFIRAWNAGDAKAVASFVSGAKEGPELDALLANKQDISNLSGANPIEKVEGDEAHVSLTISSARRTGVRNPSQTETVSLHKEGTGWKIIPARVVSLDPSNGYIASLASVVAHPREGVMLATEQGNEAVCLENVKKIATGIIFYLTSHKGLYPASFSSIQEDLNPFMKSPGAWKCPADMAGGSSYSLNDHLKGLSEPTINHPADVVMVYEGKDGKLDFRHDGKAAIAFDDGHVVLVGKAAAKTLKWTPN